jgi:hypothetical protein
MALRQSRSDLRPDVRHGSRHGEALARSICLHQCAENCERRDLMSCFHEIIEPVRKLPVLGDTTKPFAVIERELGNFSMRQYSIAQRERSVGPGFRLDQSAYSG